MRVACTPHPNNISERELIRMVIDEEGRGNFGSVRTLLYTRKRKFMHFDERCEVDLLAEYHLAVLICVLERRGAPLREAAIFDLARDLVSREDWIPSKSWLRGFFHRWKTVLKRTTSAPIEAERIEALSVESVEDFVRSYDLIEPYLMENRANLVNVDEVPVGSYGGDAGKVWAALGRPKVGSLIAKGDNLRTLIPFLSATGQIMMVVLVFTFRVSDEKIELHLPTEWDNVSKAPFPVFITTAPKGFVGNELWMLIMKKWAEVSYSNFFQKGSVLLLDNLACHVNYEIVEKCAKNYVYIWTIPPHTSHCLQPNDNGSNAALKKGAALVKQRENAQLVLHRIKVTHVLSTIILNVVRQYVSPKVIIASFKRTGIEPWDPQIIREQCEPYLVREDKIKPGRVTVSLWDHATEATERAIDGKSPTAVTVVEITERRPHMHFFKDIIASGRLKHEVQKEKEAKQEAARLRREEKKKRQPELEAAALARKQKVLAKKQLMEDLRKKREHKFLCFACGKIREPPGSWWTCLNPDHSGMCPVCYSKAKKRDANGLECPVCQTELFAGVRFPPRYPKGYHAHHNLVK